MILFLYNENWNGVKMKNLSQNEKQFS